MATVTKNNIAINFKNRLLSTLRWRLLDTLSCDKSFSKLTTKWKCCLQELVDHAYDYLINSSNLSEEIEQVNSKYNINVDPSNIIALLHDDVTMFDAMLQDNCNSRKNILKKKKKLDEEKVVSINTKLNFEKALKRNPQNFVQYMYLCQKKVHETRLSNRFDCIKNIMTFLPQDTKEEKKRAAQYWKSLWR